MSLRVKDLMRAAIEAKNNGRLCRRPTICPRHTRCPHHTHQPTSCGDQSDHLCDPCPETMAFSLEILMTALQLVVTDKTIADAKAQSKPRKKRPARRG